MERVVILFKLKYLSLADEKYPQDSFSIFHTLLAGSADAILTCKSATRPTIFKTGLQDLVEVTWT